MGEKTLARPRGGTVRIAIVFGGRVDEVLDHRLGSRDLKRSNPAPDFRLVNVSARPDIAVGTTWPFSSWDEYQAGLIAQAQAPTPKAGG